MHIEYHQESGGFSALEPEWNRLLEKSHTNTLFLTWHWQSTWWKHLGGGDLLLVGLRLEGDGRLVAIAPLFSPTGLPFRALSLVGCREVSDYLDVLVERGQEEPSYRALLDFLAADVVPAWDVIDLCNVPEASPTLARLPELARARGYQVRVELEDVCPVLELPLTWDEYLDTLDKKQRHEIRRKLRRAQQEADTRYVVVGAGHDLEAEVRAFIALHQKSSPDKNRFMDPRMQAFFVDAARVLYRCGWLQLAFVEMDGQKAAGLFNFDYGDAILVYNSGYDPEQFSSLSPGIIVTAHTIEQAIALGRQKLDFLQGPEIYKYRFGASDTRVYRLLLARPEIDLDQAWAAGQATS